MSLYNGPARGGTRGGKDQFNWETVKTDKDRECYLGHSVMAPVGRWQKDKDLTWYAKSKKDQESELADERRRVKEHEEQMMREALGLAPKRETPSHRQMDKKELDEMLRREGREADGEGREGERIKGLGNSSRLDNYGGGGGIEHEVMAGDDAELTRPLRPVGGPAHKTARRKAQPLQASFKATRKRGRIAVAHKAEAGKRGGTDGETGAGDSSDDDRSRERKTTKGEKSSKADKKEKKKRKKEAKKAKKEEKRERKRARRDE